MGKRRKKKRAKKLGSCREVSFGLAFLAILSLISAQLFHFDLYDPQKSGHAPAYHTEAKTLRGAKKHEVLRQTTAMSANMQQTTPQPVVRTLSPTSYPTFLSRTPAPTALPTASPSSKPTHPFQPQTKLSQSKIPLCRPAPHERLQQSGTLSPTCTIAASVRGNLGPVAVVLSPVIKDWIKDRWQAAKDLSGAPIPGEHWILLDLKRSCHITEVVLDWETALASQYELLGSDGPGKPWSTLYKYASHRREHETSKKHIVHTLTIPPAKPARMLKLMMLHAGTEFGMSLWRFDVLGNDA
jgi:hypothetical protein